VVTCTLASTGTDALPLVWGGCGDWSLVSLSGLTLTVAVGAGLALAVDVAPFADVPWAFFSLLGGSLIWICFAEKIYKVLKFLFSVTGFRVRG
jgi:hypothetical protein